MLPSHIAPSFVAFALIPAAGTVALLLGHTHPAIVTLTVVTGLLTVVPVAHDAYRFSRVAAWRATRRS